MQRVLSLLLSVGIGLLAAAPAAGQDCFDYGSGLPHVVQSIPLPAGGVGDIALDGDRIAVASGATLYWFHLDAAGTPSLEGSFTLPYSASVVDVEGDLVVATQSTAYLQIVDFSDPAVPVLRATVPSLGNTRDVALDGVLVTIAEDAGGLRVLDISDPDAPVQVFASGHTGVTKCAADGGICWEFQWMGIITGYDLRDPEAPAQIYYSDQTHLMSSVLAADSRDGLLRTTRVFANDPESTEYFYITTVLDVSDPAAPQSVAFSSPNGEWRYRTGTGEVTVLTQANEIMICGTGATNGERQLLETPGITGPLAERDGLLYGGIGGSLVVIDPQLSSGSPQLFAWTPTVVNGGIQSWDRSGNLVFIHVYWYDAWSFDPDYSYIKVVDLSDPAAPTALACGLFWMGTSGYPGLLTVYGDVLYTSLGTYNWRTEEHVGSFTAQANDLVIGQALYCPTSTGVDIYDLSDPAAPALSTTLFAGVNMAGERIALGDDVAYVRTTYHNKQQIAAVDVSDPLAPVVLSYLVLDAVPLAVADDVLYLQDASGLQLLDITDPTALALAGDLPLSSAVTGFAARGDLFYLGTADEMLRLGSVADPAAPILLPAYDLTRPAGAFHLLDGSLATLNATTLYTMALDCSDPGPPYAAAVGDEPATAVAVPSGLLLAQPHPNPFNPETTIRWQVLRDGPVDVGIYDLGGRLLRTLVREPQTVGDYRATWNGRDDAGRVLPSGTYLVGVRRGAALQTRKITLIK